jgi:hypothetical protein
MTRNGSTGRRWRQMPSAIATGLLLACGSNGVKEDQPGSVVDRFGVRAIYPTVAGGREWYLPETADVPDAEWVPEAPGILRLGGGAFRWDGEAGTDSQVRMNVHSPAGKAWWRNVEMTMYFRSRGTVMGGACARHAELVVRGERHSDADTIPWNQINDGVRAPAGSATWPWYGAVSGTQSVNARCLGASYHGNLYLSGSPCGQTLLEKEISHSDGYADGWRGVANLGSVAAGAWVGFKLVIRNDGANAVTHLELWEDRLADGTWSLASSFDDTGSGAGRWPASTDLDGCGAAPYGYASDQVLTWAGPWLGFRSDCQGIDFEWLSAREIAPLP